MNAFQLKLRGFHAKTVENIMTRSTGFFKRTSRDKSIQPKPDNITTYLRKFQIDRENLNLAKRILLCQSEHNHRLYNQEWKKTQNFLRVRSNFKRGLSNEEPRIFKFEPILGKGNCLITFLFTKFESNFAHFRENNVYSLQVVFKQSMVSPTISTFLLQNLVNSPMSFYVPTFLKKRKITCKIMDVKQNQNYQRGRFEIDLAISGEQPVNIFNKQGKIIACGSLKVQKCGKNKKYKLTKRSDFNIFPTTQNEQKFQDFTDKYS